MELPTIQCATALRDGGIDAMAALNDALAIALRSIPDANHKDIKHAIGRAMSAIADETINPATRAFPTLEPTEETWLAVVKDRASARAAFFSGEG